MKEVFLCTGNPGKLKEITDLIPPQIIVRTLKDEGWFGELTETGDTLEANAIQKAQWGFAHSGMPSIADDSGLEVEALNGAPGVRSARFAGDQRSDEDNMSKLLAELGTAPNRAARFRTVIAYCEAKGVVVFEGVVKGWITQGKRGTGGFGYDPIFQPEGSDLTFAEMTLRQKQGSSHRGRAVTRLIEHLFKIG
ncbi:MAG: RdgB/HAM1 family non-canonical purine NTP pyrophosphatase [Bacteroidota bacterium]|nr:RdgB/HAM1 family non-canonical purine NTP pyrophosphatase [Bacteroidota bacterium]